MQILVGLLSKETSMTLPTLLPNTQEEKNECSKPVEKMEHKIFSEHIADDQQKNLSKTSSSEHLLNNNS